MPSLTKDEVQTAYMQASARYADLNNKATVGLMDQSLTKDDYQKLVDERDQAKMQRDGLLEQVKNWDADHPAKQEKPAESKSVSLKNQKPSKEERIAKIKRQINNYVHHVPDASMIRNAGTDGQVTSQVVSPTIPEEIVYNPSAEVNSVVDLSSLITKTPVTTSKGTYPVLKRAGYVFPTVQELAENPKLANPVFNQVNWSVDTHRGALAISNESIQDSAVDVSNLVTTQLAEARVNTTNASIATVLEAFNAASATSDNLFDAFKWLLNVGLDPAYVPSIVASQTMYNALDTLKDKNGQYIFHQDVTTGSRGTLLGVPVYRVGDTLLGKAGEAHAFIGDLGRSLFFADRQQITLSWQYNEVFGQYLAGALRYGVTTADPNAGFFLSASVPASTFVQPKVTPTQGSDVAANKGTNSSH